MTLWVTFQVSAAKADVLVPLILGRRWTRTELGRMPDEIVGHTQSGRLPVEGESRVIRIAVGVHPPHRRVRAEGHLVVPAKDAEIVAQRENGVSRRPRSVIYREATGDADRDEMRRVAVCSHAIGCPSQTGVRQCARFELARSDSIRRQTERIDDVRADKVCAADRKRLRQTIHSWSGVSGRTQRVLVQIERSRVKDLLDQIPAEHRMIRALLIVDPADDLVTVFVGRVAVNDLAARIRPFSAVWPRNVKAGLLNSAGSMRLLTNGALNVICRPPLQAGEANAVKSPASIAAVGTNCWRSDGSWRTVVP